MNDCRMYAADLMVRAQKAMAGGMSISDCLAIMDVSKSGYYAWQARKEDRDGKRAGKLQELRGLMDLFLAIIRKLSYVPGKRTFRLHLLNDYGRNISTKRCRAIM
ncbi:MAG: IS3 family transposase, partial [Lachnospiraceae bacterium]|nr:IS3 family transposase [Lachnospiraceae bacterium]